MEAQTDAGHFVILPFLNNHTYSCHLLIYLLANGLVAHSGLLQIYNLIPDVLRQLFGQTPMERLESDSSLVLID